MKVILASTYDGGVAAIFQLDRSNLAHYAKPGIV